VIERHPPAPEQASRQRWWRRLATIAAVLLLEFTIEPFHEGKPGPHVTAAIAAAEAFGVTVEFGPFGSSCAVSQQQVAEVSGAIVAQAFANGATHVSLHAERLATAGAQ